MTKSSKLLNADDVREAAAAVASHPAGLRVIKHFQDRIRTGQARRAALRKLEFDSWYVICNQFSVVLLSCCVSFDGLDQVLFPCSPRYQDCKRERAVLMAINVTFLAIVGLFTLLVLLLLSAAFDEAQALIWLVAVVQNVAMQIVVTGPSIGLTILCIKLLFSRVLIDANANEKVCLTFDC